MRWPVALLLISTLISGAVGDEGEDDDEISGPIMPAKPGGAPYGSKELIEMRGYEGEEHTVTTSDGYMLNIFRILPKGGKRGVVVCQHGMMLDSNGWLTDKASLPFRLSEAGYDVWISNSRGNAYGRSHTTLKPDTDKAFWEVSLQQMATNDLPAAIDKALNVSGATKLHFVGHSMGAALGLIMAAERPETRPKLRSLVAFAPAVYLSKLVEMVGPEGMVQELAAKYVRDLDALGKLEAFPRADVARVTAAAGNQLTCADIADESIRDMCQDKAEEARSFVGGDYFPSGISWLCLKQFYQSAFNGGELRQYNQSSREANMKAYGADTPPGYTFADIATPVLLYSAVNDQLIMPKDIEDLKAKLKNVVADVRIEEPECFDHMAFITLRHKSCGPARQKLYESVIEGFNKVDASA